MHDRNMHAGPGTSILETSSQLGTSIASFSEPFLRSKKLCNLPQSGEVIFLVTSELAL